MKTMDDSTFEERFLARVEPLEPEEAWSTLHAALHALGRALDASAAQAVAEALPRSLQQSLRESDGPQDLGLDDVYQDVAHEVRRPMVRAMEQTQIVLGALADILDPPTVGRFRRELGVPLDALLEPPAPEPEPPPVTGRGRTLAEGQAGAGAPLGEADPSRPQHDSVAEANPHGDRKLSSAGSSGRTLADGKG